MVGLMVCMKEKSRAYEQQATLWRTGTSSSHQEAQADSTAHGQRAAGLLARTAGGAGGAYQLHRHAPLGTELGTLSLHLAVYVPVDDSWLLSDATQSQIKGMIVDRDSPTSTFAKHPNC